jgi:uncharacterized protein
MLYDNAQLITIYADAFRAFKEPLYKEIAEETAWFIFKEMKSPEGAYYSSLDADSEGIEGKYYTWNIVEVNQILGHHSDLIRKYYHIGGKGSWETGRNILLRTHSPEDFAHEQGYQPSAFKTILKSAKHKLLKARNKRVRPSLDNKILTSWNGLMIKALAAVNKVTGKKVYLEKARLLAGYSINHFYDEENNLFFVTSDLDPPLVARKHEIFDNVIPSSNSVMAGVLNSLGLIYEDENYLEISSKMITGMKEHFLKYPSSFSNWGSLIMRQIHPFYIIVIMGPECREKAAEMQNHYLPNAIFCASEKESNLPVFKDRFVEGKTMIYVCS